MRCMEDKEYATRTRRVNFHWFQLRQMGHCILKGLTSELDTNPRLDPATQI